VRNRLNIQFAKSFLQGLPRRNWPLPESPLNESNDVSIVFVNYNTLELTSCLLFSIFRILGRQKVSRIVAVDNNSTDGSRQMLELFAAEEMIDLIGNRRQYYHGPGINQAIAFLSKSQREKEPGSPTRYIWILDSDVILLRPDAVSNALSFLRSHEAAAVGQFQYDALAEGYAHISSLLIDPVKAWRRSIVPFDNTGAPASNFEQSLRRRGLKVADFPYRTDHYLLHLARGTLKSIHDQDDRSNKYYRWASTHAVHHYHGDPNGKQIHDAFLRVFGGEVPKLTADQLLAACQRPGLLEIPISIGTQTAH